MQGMEVHFQQLDLDQNASLEEIKQAYKDLVMVWHPDRFAHNARLRHKAEEKLKQFNYAYEYLKQWYERPRQEPPRSQPPKNTTSTYRSYTEPRSPKSSYGYNTYRGKSAQQAKAPPPRTGFNGLHISFADAEYILRRYCFEPLTSSHSPPQEYQSGPFTLIVSQNPLHITLAVPCHSLQHFDRILLSIPCKSTGHFSQAEAQSLLQLLQISDVKSN